MQKYLPFIMYYGSGFVVVYKHFDRLLHVRSLDPTCVQNFRSVPVMVFEIVGFKLKNKNKKNWRSGLFAISVVQF